MPVFRVRRDPRGRARVQLSPGHRFANSGGWQWVNRFVAMSLLERELATEEHVHHVDHDRKNDAPSNLEVVVAEYHGWAHATHMTIAGARGPDGKFVEMPEPEWPPRFVGRWGAVIGPAARDEAPAD